MTDKERNKLVGRFVLAAASLFTYLPVIAGILTPMLWLLPAWYSAWFFVGFIFPFSSMWGGLWLPINDLPTVYLVWTIEAAVFLVGFTLFIYSLGKLIQSITSGVPLVTSGPYLWVRHPQHLGIIIFLLPLALFNLSSPLTGIRPGDILSWSLVSFMLLIMADIEEIGLAKKFGTDYTEYCNSTPFLLPRLSIFGYLDKYALLSRGKPLRYVVWFAVYWCVVSLILFGFTFLELHWTR